MRSDYLAAVKYAKALLALAEERNEAKLILDELVLATAFFGQDEGRTVLAHPLLPADKKKQVLQNVLADRVGSTTMALLFLLVEKRRGLLLTSITNAYREQYHLKESFVEAEVTTARPLTENQLDQLKLKLEMFAGKDIDLVVTIDNQLQAGAKVQLGDLVLDGTLKGRIEQLKKSMMLEN